MQRPRECRDLAAAVAGQLDVVSEQRLEAGEITLFGSREEPCCQLFALLARGLEPGPVLLDMLSGAGRELADVVLALADDRRDRCPYKGTAGYFSVNLASGDRAKDLVWFYEEPFPEVGRIAGLLSFFNEKVEIELDGVLQEQPESPWSHGVKSDDQNAHPAQTRG